MFEMITDVLLDALIDSLKLLPFLFGAYLLIEFFEHKASDKLSRTLTKLGPLGTVGGALLGCVPQCGFSVVAANLYSGGLITIGTLIAVFISTSDEAIPVLLAHPDKAGEIWKLLLVKVIIAIIAGIVIDLVVKLFIKKKAEPEMYNELCEHCGCEHGILRSSLKHTGITFLFILIVNIVLGGAIAIMGEEALFNLLGTGSVFQPFVAALLDLSQTAHHQWCLQSFI